MADYYVSNDGNDSGTGAIGDPWATIGKANTTVVNNDNVFLRRGGTWLERIDISGLTGVTFSAYGPGPPPNVGGPATNVGILSNCTNCTIELINGVGGSFDQGNQITVSGSGNTIRGCMLDQADNKNILLTSATNCIVENNRCTNALAQAITLFSNSSGNTVRNNYIEMNNGNGNGIFIHGAASSNNIVEKNHVHEGSTSAPTLQCIALNEFNDGPSDNTFRYNLITGNWRRCVHIQGNGQSVVFANIMIADKVDAQPQIECSNDSNTAPTLIYANTIYARRVSVDFRSIDARRDYNCRNNVIVNEGNLFYLENATAAPSTYTGDFNYFFGGTRARPFNANAPTPNNNETFAGHQTYTSQDASSAEADPQLQDPANGLYYPALGSPLQSAGESITNFDTRVDPTSTFPFDVRIVSSTTIGAYSGAIQRVTVGTGGDKNFLFQVWQDYNAGLVAANGESLVAVLLNDIQEDSALRIDAATAASVSVQTTAQAVKAKITCTASSVSKIWFGASSGANPVYVDDIVIDGNGLGTGSTIGGMIVFESAHNSTINRSEFFGMSTAANRLGIITYNAPGTATTNINNCIIHDCVSTRDANFDNHGAILSFVTTLTANINNTLIDNITAGGPTFSAPVGGTRSGSGNLTVNATNSAVTRVNGSGATASFFAQSVNLTTCGTFDALGSVTGIDETEYLDADGNNYRLTSESQLLDAGTTIIDPDAAIAFDGVDRFQNSDRNPWDISPYAAAKSGDPPVSWTRWQPSRLRACWTTPNGVDLKRSHTTDSYSGGNPTAATDLKPSIVDYDTGNLKSGLTIGGDIKPSILKAT